ncbi:TetR/AcrR family transcriptional regulator [Herbaspirillum chlorophenolicum]|uniref:TetR/AcrR family transcriptional regulator n=1 Tax=Herbaspirillum chlorophenolicum TaxID=211589 RepID=A0ABW8EWC9_9BURK|nr:TetR/AcrR family transcriptional regulator [Herbaspirillum chlorophenolicum]
MSDPEETGRRERKRVQMLGHLADTAARLFAAHGFDSVTMEQIAAEADVAKRTLYNHFPTKEATLAYWMDAELERDLAGLQDDVAKCPTFVSRLSCVLEASAAWCEKHPDYLVAYLRHRFLSIVVAGTDGNGTNGNGSDIMLAWQHLIAEGQRTGELNKNSPADQLATWFHHLYLGALLRWLTIPRLSLQKELNAITTLFIEGAGIREQAQKTPPPKTRSR